MTAPALPHADRLTDWEPRLAPDRLCAGESITLLRQRRRRRSWAQIAEFVLTGVVVCGLGLVVGVGLAIPS